MTLFFGFRSLWKIWGMCVRKLSRVCIYGKRSEEWRWNTWYKNVTDKRGLWNNDDWAFFFFRRNWRESLNRLSHTTTSQIIFIIKISKYDMISFSIFGKDLIFHGEGVWNGRGKVLEIRILTEACLFLGHLWIKPMKIRSKFLEIVYEN